MYAALRKARERDCEINSEIYPAAADDATAATAAAADDATATATATATALMPMTASCAQRSRSRPASLPAKLNLQPDLMDQPDQAPTADAEAPLSAASTPANSWNAFQKAVRGRGLSKPQVCHMYAALKQEPARHLSWNGFQQRCGGKGYSKATLSQMYATCKSAERQLFEEAASPSL